MTERSITRRTLLRTSAVAATLGVTAPWVITPSRAAKPDHVLTFGHTFGKATEEAMITGLDVWKKTAEELADGKLLVDIHEAGSLGGQPVLPQKVLTGAIQGCQLSTQNFTPFSDIYNLLDFPYLFSSNEKFESALSSDAFNKSDFVKQPASKGFLVLPGMWANAGFRVLGVSRKANKVVKNPDDLKDVKIRVTGSKIEQQIFKLTPANPVSIDWAETYQALQQGAADALNVGLGPLTATKIYETLGSATMSEINFNCHITVLNKSWFDKLPAGVQEALYQAAAKSFEFQKAGQANANQKMIELWKSKGITVHVLSPEEKKVWNDSIGHRLPVWDSYKKQYGAEQLEQLVKMAS